LDEGDRIFIEDSLEVQKEWDLEEQDYLYLDKFNWVHHTIFSNWNLEGKNKIQDYERTILEQVSTIRERGLNLSIDFSEKFDQDLIVSLGPLVEVGIFSRPGIPDLEIPQTLQTLHDLGFGLVIVTMGERGSAAYDGQDVFRQAAVPVEVIDTLGVGDAFIGAFLAQYVVNSSVPSSLKHAAEYSAHYCTVEGAF